MIKSKHYWQYSRNCRRHWVDDGNMYHGGDGRWAHPYLIEIRDLTPYGFVRQCHKDGYGLYHKGKLVKKAQTVKELKDLAETL